MKYRRPTVLAKTAALAHWQLFWFSLLSLLFGAGSLYRMVNTNPGLPAGVDELPFWWLSLQTGVWLGAGAFGVYCSFFLPGREALCRGLQGVLLCLWGGGYFFGWIWQDAKFGWFGAFLFLFLAGAVFTPPAWHVTIRPHHPPE